MQKELKDAIIKKVQENTNEFQLHNLTTDTFSKYIFDDKGEYLIGGEEVAKFISEFITLYVN